jgi:beta-lactam-binding protein with PASTA domain
VAEARPLITDAQLEIAEVREEASDQPEGTVLSIDPPEGSDVEVGSSVTLVASSGQVEVPQVVGLPSGEAQAILRQAGFNVSVLEEDSTEPVGTVTFQAPAAGTEASFGSRVAITVAQATTPQPTPTPTATTTPTPTAQATPTTAP